MLKSKHLADPVFEENKKKEPSKKHRRKPGDQRQDVSLKECFAALSLAIRHMARSTMRAHRCSPDEALEQIFSKFDRDGDGGIDWEEFESVLAGLLPSMRVEEVKALFSFMDQDGNDQISVSEFRDMIADDDTSHFHKHAHGAESVSLPSLGRHIRDAHANERCLPLNRRSYFSQNLARTNAALRAARIRQRSSTDSHLMKVGPLHCEHLAPRQLSLAVSC